MSNFFNLSDQVLRFEPGCRSYEVIKESAIPTYSPATLGADFNEIADDTFTFEGGYQAFPNDSANYNSRNELVGTNRGISAIAYETYLNRPPTVADMKAITEAKAKAVYKKLFWDFMAGDRINNDSVAHIMFDSFIATGNVILARKGINAVASSNQKVSEKHTAFNDYTVNVVNSLDQKRLFDAVKNLNIAQRKRLAEQNPSKYAMFLKGWLARLDKINFSTTAIAVASGGFFLSQALHCFFG